jgi:hypothetical protein
VYRGETLDYGINYYNNYLLDGIYNFDLSESQISLLDAAIWLVDNKTSLRKTADNCGYSKTYLHQWFHKDLKKLSYELYTCVIRQLNKNKVRKFR